MSCERTQTGGVDGIGRNKGNVAVLEIVENEIKGVSRNAAMNEVAEQCANVDRRGMAVQEAKEEVVEGNNQSNYLHNK